MTEIRGDFLLQGIGNGDAKVGGFASPWYIAGAVILSMHWMTMETV